MRTLLILFLPFVCWKWNGNPFSHTVQVHCFELSSALSEDHFLDSEILCEPHANFVPILEADTLIDLGENKYLTALKKGHTPAAWKQKIFFY